MIICCHSGMIEYNIISHHMPCLLFHTTHLVTFHPFTSSCLHVFFTYPHNTKVIVQPSWETSVLVVILETLQKSSVVHQFLCLPNTAGSIGGSEQQIVGKCVGKDTHACKDLKIVCIFILRILVSGQIVQNTYCIRESKQNINRTH